MRGAKPYYLSVGFILEEGFAVKGLRRILASMRDAAAEANISIVTGDIKAVQKGGADKVFINASGIGVIASSAKVSASGAKIGDKVILNGTLGNHGATVQTQLFPAKF